MKRKYLLRFVICFVVAATSIVPTKMAGTDTHNAPDLQIVKISWRGGQRDYTGRTRGAFSIDVKNIGKKVITAVEWEFVLYDSIRNNAVTDQMNFRTDDKRIKPGEKIRLTKRPDYISEDLIENNISGTAYILKIEYADNTSWKKPE